MKKSSTHKNEENTSSHHNSIPELTETTENYIKHIYFLVNQKGEARVSELSRVLNRSMSSVSEAVRRLQDQGLVIFQKYGAIELTPLGFKVGSQVAQKHNLFYEFLRLIGVDEMTADSDACSMEHFIHDATLKSLQEFLQFLKSNPLGIQAVLEFQKTLDS